MSEYKNRIYHLKGSPFEIRYAMGQSLGSKLEANIERYVRERVSPGCAFDTEAWRSGALPWLHTLPARFQEEFEGLAQGTKLPLQRLAEWAYLEVILSGRCSGAVVTIDDRAWVARNNDFFAPDMWGYVTMMSRLGGVPAASRGNWQEVEWPW